MAEVAYNQNPTITDTVVFDLYVPDANGCFSEMPYKVNNLTIYFVERNFQSGNQAIYKEMLVIGMFIKMEAILMKIKFWGQVQVGVMMFKLLP